VAIDVRFARLRIDVEAELHGSILAPTPPAPHHASRVSSALFLYVQRCA
jgi:hypothetical protein